MWNLNKRCTWTYLHVQTQRLGKQTYSYQRGQVGRGRGMDLGYGTGTGTLRQGKTGPQEPSVQHRELYPVFCDHPSGKRISKRVEVCLCITESLCGRAEIITTLQNNYTSIKCLKNGKKMKLNKQALPWHYSKCSSGVRCNVPTSQTRKPQPEQARFSRAHCPSAADPRFRSRTP